MSDHRRPATNIPYPHLLVPELSVRLLYASDNLKWEGVIVRSYHVIPFEPPPFSFGENMIHLQVGGNVTLTRRAEGKVQCGLSYSGNMSIQPKDMPVQWAWTGIATVLHIHLIPSLFNSLITEISHADPTGVEVKNDFNVRDPLIQHIGFALASALETEGPVGGLYAESLAQTLSLHILHHYSSLATINLPRVSKLSADQLRRVIDYMNEHLDQPLTLSDLATCIGLSPARFSKAFRESTHITPHQYLIQHRVERAQGLLLAGKLTIAEVARETGFVDQSHLTRHFKRQLGVTPRLVFAAGKNVQNLDSNLQDSHTEFP